MNGIIRDFFEGFLTVGDLIHDLKQSRPSHSPGLGNWLIWMIVVLSLAALLVSPYIALQYGYVTAALWVSMSGIFSSLGLLELKRRTRNRRVKQREHARRGFENSW
jgi:hypothetical protein